MGCLLVHWEHHLESRVAQHSEWHVWVKVYPFSGNGGNPGTDLVGSLTLFLFRWIALKIRIEIVTVIEIESGKWCRRWFVGRSELVPAIEVAFIAKFNGEFKFSNCLVAVRLSLLMEGAGAAAHSNWIEKFAKMSKIDLSFWAWLVSVRWNIGGRCDASRLHSWTATTVVVVVCLLASPCHRRHWVQKFVKVDVAREFWNNVAAEAERQTLRNRLRSFVLFFGFLVPFSNFSNPYFCRVVCVLVVCISLKKF